MKKGYSINIWILILSILLSGCQKAKSEGVSDITDISQQEESSSINREVQSYRSFYTDLSRISSDNLDLSKLYLVHIYDNSENHEVVAAGFINAIGEVIIDYSTNW